MKQNKYYAYCLMFLQIYQSMSGVGPPAVHTTSWPAAEPWWMSIRSTITGGTVRETILLSRQAFSQVPPIYYYYYYFFVFSKDTWHQCYKVYIFKINALFFWTVDSSKDPEKNHSLLPQQAQLVFNTDNNKKHFLSTILEWFLKDHVTLKTGLMMLKIQRLPSQ